MLEETTNPELPTFKMEGYVKCFDPEKCSFFHYHGDNPVVWTYGLDNGSYGQINCALKDVPRTGLFIYKHKIYQRT